jgi:hypothetical protein
MAVKRMAHFLMKSDTGTAGRGLPPVGFSCRGPFSYTQVQTSAPAVLSRPLGTLRPGSALVALRCGAFSLRQLRPTAQASRWPTWGCRTPYTRSSHDCGQVQGVRPGRQGTGEVIRCRCLHLHRVRPCGRLLQRGGRVLAEQTGRQP